MQVSRHDRCRTRHYFFNCAKGKPIDGRVVGQFALRVTRSKATDLRLPSLAAGVLPD
jgi:hypothetical protein